MKEKLKKEIDVSNKDFSKIISECEYDFNDDYCYNKK